ncbi:hypothetical protein Q8W37_21010 [Shimia thalassica]|uniref:imm11 family protein n=1 Tax=Shimia thalassica TaxID=1715693 RepID=UPI0027352652|nr:DUF1629 domain-containing protein [Shimia thalassica]MDP2582427.1 hypothetical protein [Shimia thalassica]
MTPEQDCLFSWKNSHREIIPKVVMSSPHLPSNLPLVIETPDGKVKRPATFYCYFGSVLDGHLSFERLAKSPSFPPVEGLDGGRRRVNPDWILKHSPFFEPQKVPSDIGGAWRHYRLTASPDQMAQFVAPLRISFDKLADHIPAFAAWPPFGLVSAHARDILEQIDPSGSVFIPADLRTSNGAPVNSTHFHWIPRDRLYFEEPSWPLEERAKHVKTLPFSGPFAFPTVSWQLSHNSALRHYLADISFWGMGVDMIRFAFNANAFATLRAANCTGLVENTAEYASERNSHESIGHIL